MLEHYLIGTYTHHTSQGIYSVTLDTSAGRLSPTRLEIPIQKPIFMTFANNGILYTIEKLDQDHAAITSFKEEGAILPGSVRSALRAPRPLIWPSMKSANCSFRPTTTFRPSPLTSSTARVACKRPTRCSKWGRLVPVRNKNSPTFTSLT